MTLTLHRRPDGQPTSSRSDLELLEDQLAAVDAWNADRRAQESADRAVESSSRSRETRLDASRRGDVLRRQHDALLRRVAEQMHEAHLLRTQVPVRAVIVHRNAWFRDKLSAALEAAGVVVVAQVENGADAVGLVVAEQPDLLLVEDRLPMLGGAAVLRQVARFAPRTVCAAQVEYDTGIPEMLDAWARSAFTRRVPPAQVGEELAQLVLDQRLPAGLAVG